MVSKPFVALGRSASHGARSGSLSNLSSTGLSEPPLGGLPSPFRKTVPLSIYRFRRVSPFEKRIISCPHSGGLSPASSRNRRNAGMLICELMTPAQARRMLFAVHSRVYAGTMFDRLWRRAGNSARLKLWERCARSHRARRFRLGSKRRRSVEMQRGRQRSHRRLCGADRLLPWPRGPPTWKRSSRPPTPCAMSRPSRPASRRRQPALRQWIPARRPCFTLAKSLRLIPCVLDRVARPPTPRRGNAATGDNYKLSPVACMPGRRASCQR